MCTIVAGLAEFELDLIRERIMSGMARADAAIKRDGFFVTRAGKERKSIGRQEGERPSEKHAKVPPRTDIRPSAFYRGASAVIAQSELHPPIF